LIRKQEIICKLFNEGVIGMKAGKSLVIVAAVIAVVLVVAIWADSNYFAENHQNSNTQSTPSPQPTPTASPQASPTLAPTSTPTPIVTVTGSNIHIQYPNDNDTYFGAAQQGLSLPQAYVGVGGQPITLSFIATEPVWATGNHWINSVIINTPGFTLTSVNPTLPIQFSPGSSTVITFVLQSPNANFDGAISITLVTS
jgi:hypothetical protein